MTSERRLISFASSASSSKGGPRSKENGPDGHGRLELSCFLTPPLVADHRNAPVNALGYLRVMFAVDDIDETLERLRKRGAQLVGEVVQYKDAYRLCYIRGPEGLLIGLAQELS
jgi:catechol 2,3-dioxygenase-like lactoylglutathione lyase family enzyme